MDASAYRRQLAQLLPRGSLWALDSGSVLSKLLLGIADELARVDGRAEDLVEEWDPRTADECLEDWERVLGLSPDEADTVANRRLAATARFIAQGGCTAAYFTGIATALGFDVVSFTRTNYHTMTMTVQQRRPTWTNYVFRAGAARSGDPLSYRRIPALENEINRWKPAHVKVLFVYQLIGP